MRGNSGGFVDLRVQHSLAASHTDDSVWPSFTDIMMVVVIIFLMASVIFMLRNVQLGVDLQSAELSESEAMQQIGSLQDRLSYLSEIIAQTKDELALTAQQRDELRALSEERAARIGELEVTASNLYATKIQLETHIETLRGQVSEYEKRAQALTARIASLNTVVADLDTLISEKTNEYNVLQSELAQTRVQLASISTELDTRTLEYQSLSESHADLKAVQGEQLKTIEELERIGSDDRKEIARLTEETESKSVQLQELTETSAAQQAELAEQLQQMVLTDAHRQATIEQLSEQRAELRAALEGESAASGALREEAAANLQQIAQLHDRLQETQAEYQRLTALGQEQMNEIEQLEKFRAENTVTIERQKQEITNLRAAYETQVSQTESLLQQLATKERALGGIEEQFQTQSGELERLQLAHTSLNERIALMTEMERAHLITLQDREQELSSLHTQLTQMLDDAEVMQQRYAQREAEIIELRRSLNDAKVKNARLETISEQQADEIVELTQERFEDTKQIEVLNESVSDYRTQMTDAQTAERALQREVDYLEQQLTSQTERLNRLLAFTEQLGGNISKRDEKIEQLTGETDELRELRRQAVTDLNDLKAAYQERLAELAELQVAVADQSSEAQQLRSQIVELTEENQLLLRPARSSVGRYIVDIRYTKDDNNTTIIQYRLPESNGFTQIGRPELEALLAELKNTKKAGLYTKIVFPDEDRVNFSEAWEFTQDILAGYDYYYQ